MHTHVTVTHLYKQNLFSGVCDYQHSFRKGKENERNTGDLKQMHPSVHTLTLCFPVVVMLGGRFSNSYHSSSPHHGSSSKMDQQSRCAP